MWALIRLVTEVVKLVRDNNYKTSRPRFVSFIAQTEKNVHIIWKIWAMIKYVNFSSLISLPSTGDVVNQLCPDHSHLGSLTRTILNSGLSVGQFWHSKQTQDHVGGTDKMFPIYLIIKVKTELGSLQSFYRPRYKKISSEQEQSKSAKQICKLIYNIITRY